MAGQDQDAKQPMTGITGQSVPTRGVSSREIGPHGFYLELLWLQAERRMRDAHMRDAEEGARSAGGVPAAPGAGGEHEEHDESDSGSVEPS
jgi:hypothetical protein